MSGNKYQQYVKICVSTILLYENVCGFYYSWNHTIADTPVVCCLHLY